MTSAPETPNHQMQLSRTTVANLLKERGWYPKSPDASVFVNEKNPVRILVITEETIGGEEWTAETGEIIRLESEGVVLPVSNFDLTEDGVRKALEAATSLVSVAG